MASKVYLLTGIFLDERQVFATFSTREKAEAALRFGDEECAVEEFELDGPLPSAPPEHSLWHVQEFRGYSVFRITAFDRDDVDQVIDEGDSFTVNVWARDEVHALGTATERINRYKADHGAAA